MSAPAQPATSQIGFVDAQRVEKALSLIAPKWTTWSAQTLAQQGGPMRVRDVAARLPFVSEQFVGKRLAQTHDDGLVIRAGDRHGAPYQLSGFGNALSSVHRALSDWSHAHLPLGKVAGAERVEDAVRRLHLRYSTAVIQVLDAGGPRRFVHIAQQAGLANSFTRQRLIRLQLDGLVTRTGPRHGDPYVLTAAGRGTGPGLRSHRALEQPRRRTTSRPCPGHGGHPHPHGHPAGSDGIRTSAALRRSTAAPRSLFSHAPQPQPRVPVAVAAQSASSRGR
ncbi:winged helix-turn-helix transcriptional regulator [Streptomyces europaeiscabiei]|uniref:winged helix-turn-helix transcriptional regulator n=1 Tax=Streptomyces europaeiscabiei TaxID=146819 RepID=UPI002E195416